VLDAARITELLEQQAPDGRPTFNWLREQAPEAELVAALRAAQASMTRHLLCDLLGYREVASGVPVLLGCLADHDVGVRGAAAEALMNIFSAHPEQATPEAREALMQRWELEEHDEIRRTLVLALGAARHGPFAPTLEALLDDPDKLMRKVAVRAFAWHGGVDAGPRLLGMFAAEENPYERASLARLLGHIGYRPAIPALRAALNDPLPVLREDAAEAVAQLEAA